MENKLSGWHYFWKFTKWAVIILIVVWSWFIFIFREEIKLTLESRFGILHTAKDIATVTVPPVPNLGDMIINRVLQGGDWTHHVGGKQITIKVKDE